MTPHTFAMKFTITLLVLFVFHFQTCMAQIVDRTEDRAKQKTNQRIDRKIDQGIDSGLDAIEGLFGKKKKTKESPDQDEAQTTHDEEGDSSDAAAKMMAKYMGTGGESPANIEKNYDFHHSIELNISAYNSRDKEDFSQNMTMLINEDNPYTGMIAEVEGQSSFIIFDTQNNQMITLVESSGQKFGMTMKFDPDQIEDDEVHEGSTGSFTATGKSKKIAGFNCQEYKVENSENDEDMDMFVWMTKETDISWMESFGNMAQSNKQVQASPLPANYPGGVMMEMVAISNKNGDKTITTVQKVNENDERAISTEGYSFMNMGGQ